MSDFTPITTQEAFDEAIKERIGRVSKKYEGYFSPEDVEKIKGDYDKQIADMASAAEATNKKYADFDKQIADRDAKIKSYETASVKNRIAHEMGLPYGASEYLKGEKEEEIKASAEAVKAMFGVGKKKAAAPMASTENTGDVKKAALSSLLAGLKGE